MSYVCIDGHMMGTKLKGTHMINRKETQVLSAFTHLTRDLGEALRGGSPRKAIEMSQALDRLYLGYELGRYTEEQAMSGMQEIRSCMQSPGLDAMDVIASSVSRSASEDLRIKNVEGALSRLLSEPQRVQGEEQVELLQALVGEHSALAQSPEQRSYSAHLQMQLSQALMSRAGSTTEEVVRLQEESEQFATDLSENLSHAASKFETRDFAVDEAVRYFATQAEISVLKRNVEAQGTDFANVYVAAQRLQELQSRTAQNRQAWVMANAQLESHQSAEILREASLAIARQESQKNQVLQQNVLRVAAPLAQWSEGKALLEHELDSTEQSSSAVVLSSRLGELVELAQSKQMSALAAELVALREQAQGIALRSEMAQSIESFDFDSVHRPEIADDAEQLLAARTLYQQQVMKFEQSHVRAQSSAELLKALDYEIPMSSLRSLPRMEAPKAMPSQDTGIAWERMRSEIIKVHAIAQSAASQDIGLVSPRAGASVANVNEALRITDNAAPMATRSFDKPNSANATISQVLGSLQQLAYAPSLRTELGFVGARYKMEDNSQAPLFKRVSFNRNDESVKQILPSIYRVAGLRSKQSAVSSAPLRKSFKGLNLSGANFELVKILEEQFDSQQVARFSDTVSGLSLEPAQNVKDIHSDVDRISSVASEWVEKKEKTDYSADTRSLIESGAKSPTQVEGSLRAEAKALPTSVQAKLAPYLGFDLSKVKIFSGPIAEMASTAMGAQAFTLGKNIFFGAQKLDLQSPEGLGLLAHELLHTAHFSSGDSVGTKERAAEAMEQRVKKAFSPTNKELALEGGGSSKKTSEVGNHGQEASAGSAIAPHSVGKRPKYDMDNLVDHVTEMLTDWMSESMDREKQRSGEG